MTFQYLKLEYTDTIAILSFNRPKLMNSLKTDVAKEMLEVLAHIRELHHIRALILTGEGKAFCAGAELNDDLMNGTENISASEVLNADMQNYFNPWIEQISNFHIPVVVAVNGAAAGAGVGIALAADITIASDEAYFLLSFMPKLGLIPDMGASWFLPRLIGLAQSKALTLLGETMTAQQAFEHGLIWQTVPHHELMENAIKIAEKLAALPKHAIKNVRAVYAYSQHAELHQQLDYERERQCELIELDSFKEGVNAFREKRKPKFH